MMRFNKGKVKLTKTSEGSHGDHWGAFLGFDESVSLGECVDDFVDDLKVETVLKNASKLRANYGSVSILGVQVDDSLLTLFPALFSAKKIPVNIKEIIEWEHVGGIEGQILGLGWDTFAVNFFATDYLENLSQYKKGGEQQVSLTGVAYVVDEMVELPSGFSEEFCSYMPSSQTNSDNDYDFIGKILSVRDVNVKNHELCEIEVKLINDEENKDMFNLPIVTSKSNLRCAELKVGDRVSGCLWLLGCINA
jgi:hypothetical protein